jgi:hypothetical protein
VEGDRNHVANGDDLDSQVVFFGQLAPPQLEKMVARRWVNRDS